MNRFVFAIVAMIALLILVIPTGILATPPAGAGRTPAPIDLNAPAVPGQFIVKFKPDMAFNNRAAVVAERGGNVIKNIAKLDVDVVEFAGLTGKADPKATAALIDTLKQNPNVVYVEPNYIYTVNFTPNDPNFGAQYGWTKVSAQQAWDITKGSATTVIAIVDTGIQRNHPDLDAKIVAGKDFIDNDLAPDDGNGHGTHVGGTSAAETNNATGGAGLCPNCKLMPVRVLDNAGSGTLEGVANGIIFAADNGAKVINLSLGATSGAATMESAVNYAWGKGVFLACAAGNNGDIALHYPAFYANCFAVASTNSTDAKSSFSTYGNWVEAAAPGEDIFSTWMGSGYDTISGTSMAAPHVAGLAGLLSGQGLTNAQIRDRICSTADRIADTGTAWTCGRINAFRAVSSGPNPIPPTPTPIVPTPTPGPGVNLLVNGGFENGTSPWVANTNGGISLIDRTRPRTGSYSVHFGDLNNASQSIYQTATIPANGKLTYSWHMTTQEPDPFEYDFLRVRVYSTSGALLGTLRTWTNTSGAGLWRTDTVSLATWAGQTVRVRFSSTSDDSLSTAFFVDDVSLR